MIKTVTVTVDGHELSITGDYTPGVMGVHYPLESAHDSYPAEFYIEGIEYKGVDVKDLLFDLSKIDYETICIEELEK